MSESQQRDDTQQLKEINISKSDLRIILVIFVALVIVLVIADTIASMLGDNPGDIIKSVADLVRALDWPLAIAVVLFMFRTAITNKLSRITKVTVPGGSIELEKIVNQQLQKAISEASNQTFATIGNLSQEDLQRARVVDRATTNENLPEFRNKMLDLAAEYR